MKRPVLPAGSTQRPGFGIGPPTAAASCTRRPTHRGPPHWAAPAFRGSHLVDPPPCPSGASTAPETAGARAWPPPAGRKAARGAGMPVDANAPACMLQTAGRAGASCRSGGSPTPRSCFQPPPGRPVTCSALPSAADRTERRTAVCPGAAGLALQEATSRWVLQAGGRAGATPEHQPKARATPGPCWRISGRAALGRQLAHAGCARPMAHGGTAT